MPIPAISRRWDQRPRSKASPQKPIANTRYVAEHEGVMLATNNLLSLGTMMRGPIDENNRPVAVPNTRAVARASTERIGSTSQDPNAALAPPKPASLVTDRRSILLGAGPEWTGKSNVLTWRQRLIAFYAEPRLRTRRQLQQRFRYLMSQMECLGLEALRRARVLRR
jgi:hypothetical protein